MYKNIPIRKRVTEGRFSPMDLGGVQRRRHSKRSYPAHSPLRDPGVVDASRIYMIISVEGQTNFARYLFSSRMAAERFLRSVADGDPKYSVTDVYNFLRSGVTQQGI